MPKFAKFFRENQLVLLLIFFFILTRLPYLGQEIFNTDVWKWKARTYDFGQGVFTLDFEKTIQKYHPGVTLMWVGVWSVKAYNGFYEVFLGHAPLDNSVSTIFELHFVQKLFLVVTIATALGFTLHVLKEHFGKRFSLFFALLLFFEPFYYALTRVFHLEGLMSTLMLASFLWYYHFLQDKKFSRLAISAVFAGLAFLTKTSAVYMLPFVALLTIIDYFFHQKPPQKIFLTFAKWLLVFLATFIIFWPAMWTMPLKALSELYRGVSSIGVDLGHEQFYFNKFTMDPGPSYYFVVLALRSSPFLFLGTLGSFLTLKSYNSKEKKFFLYALLFSFFYFIQVTLPSKKLDRYILPSLLGLVLLSTYFYLFLFAKLGRKWGSALILSIALFSAFTIFSLKKDYFSYFNPLFGGLEKGIFILEPKWMIGHHEISTYFSQLKSPAVIAFPEKYYTQIYPFIQKIGHTPVIESITPEAQKANFFVYPVWEDTSATETRFSLKLVDSIYLRGVEVYRVYSPFMAQ